MRPGMVVEIVIGPKSITKDHKNSICSVISMGYRETDYYMHMLGITR